MKTLLLLCTKNVHFSFNDQLYKQVDGVVIGSPLVPVLAGIFMTELENKLVPTLKEYPSFWRRYTDDTLCFVKEGSCEFVLAIFNIFHRNIKFTYEIGSNNMISFLDVLLVERESCIDTAVFRKSTNSNLYINWNSFAPEVWKKSTLRCLEKSTLRCLVKRAYKVCNQNYFLHMELEHLQTKPNLG